MIRGNMQKEILLTRKSKNKLNPAITKAKLEEIVAACERNSSLGLIGKLGKLTEPKIILDKDEQECKVYSVKVLVSKRATVPAGREAVAEKHILMGIEAIKKAAIEEKWSVVDKEGNKEERKSVGNLEYDEEYSKTEYAPEFVVPELTQEMYNKYFSGVYERDAHIRLIHSAAQSYIQSLAGADESGVINRSHVLLKGKPAGCKTTLFERFKSFYDNEGSPDGTAWERVAFVDGPTMTKAGLENWLISRAESQMLPKFLVIEEIEKQDLNNLLTLISVMGSGYLSKINARVQFKQETNLVIWATCNDEETLKKFRGGALWSRFSYVLHCVRPSRELMYRILLERIAKTGGKDIWAEKAIEFAYETAPRELQETWDDPRKIIGLLDGKEKLEDYSWQRDILSIAKAEALERALDCVTIK